MSVVIQPPSQTHRKRLRPTFSEPHVETEEGSDTSEF